MSRVASAPGKVLWAGEYAVLRGAHAVVCAVERRAHARVLPDDAPAPHLSAFLAAARDEIGFAYGYQSREARAAARVVVDSSALAQTGIKLGLGSSAAATVAAVAAALASEDPMIIHPLAHRAHAAAQAPRGSRGSGADIAASVHGGLLEVWRDGEDDARPLRVRRLALPAGLTPVLVWTGEAADTPTLVARVRGFAEQRPGEHQEALRRIEEAAQALVEAFALVEARPAVAAMAAAGDALARLGELSGAPLVPASLARLAALARRHHGAAKPTGAGGGDQILAVFADPLAAAGFSADVRALGMSIVTAAPEPVGTRLDAGPETE